MPNAFPVTERIFGQLDEWLSELAAPLLPLKKAGVTVPAAGSDLKKDDISPSHLQWLVDSRTANQNAALKLYTLLCDHSEQMVTKEWFAKAQHLVAACFSLWRAAFLADKGVKRSEVQAHARTFLAKILVDNAITYPQDRSTRNWTFNLLYEQRHE